MSDIDLTHRCSEPKCVSFGQATHPSGCLCHMTQVEMAKERITDLSAALERLVGVVDMGPQFPTEPDSAIGQARAALKSAHGEQS